MSLNKTFGKLQNVDAFFIFMFRHSQHLVKVKEIMQYLFNTETVFTVMILK